MKIDIPKMCGEYNCDFAAVCKDTHGENRCLLHLSWNPDKIPEEIYDCFNKILEPKWSIDINDEK